jgi:transposase
MSNKRVYKQHTLAFKEEALVTEQGYSVAEAAESLGTRTNQLYE